MLELTRLPNKAKLIILLVAQSNRFTAEAEAYSNKLSQRQADRDRLRRERKLTDPPTWEHQTQEIRAAIGTSLALVLAVVILASTLGIVLNQLLGPPSQHTGRAILYSGIGIFLWVTLGKGGGPSRPLPARPCPSRLIS